MTGPRAWFGEQMERGAPQAAADLNGAGGVLGEGVGLITADDFCDPEQASEEFGRIGGLAAEGALFTDVADPRRPPRLRPSSSDSERQV
jgi:ABC-type branched-subunit amino acid transport system substrate-binding protein